MSAPFALLLRASVAIAVFGLGALGTHWGSSKTTGSLLVKKGSRMEIKRSGTQPSGKGPAEYFTGTVRLDPLFQSPDPARALGVSVTFEPGARTAWHTH
jgi:hypothetical protein